MERNILDVGGEENLASPDGTPPSNGLAEEAFRSATPTYYRRGQGWLGTDYVPDARPTKTPGVLVEGHGNGNGDATEGSDIVGLMEAIWCVFYSLACQQSFFCAYIRHTELMWRVIW